MVTVLFVSLYLLIRDIPFTEAIFVVTSQPISLSLTHFMSLLLVSLRIAV
jgi:hypothetical protein